MEPELPIFEVKIAIFSLFNSVIPQKLFLAIKFTAKIKLSPILLGMRYAEIFSESIFLGLNLTLHTHTPIYRYPNPALHSTLLVVMYTSSVLHLSLVLIPQLHVLHTSSLFHKHILSH